MIEDFKEPDNDKKVILNKFLEDDFKDISTLIDNASKEDKLSYICYIIDKLDESDVSDSLRDFLLIYEKELNEIYKITDLIRNEERKGLKDFD